MEDLNVVDSINGAGSWLVANQALLLSYAVNIVMTMDWISQAEYKIILMRVLP